MYRTGSDERGVQSLREAEVVTAPAIGAHRLVHVVLLRSHGARPRGLNSLQRPTLNTTSLGSPEAAGSLPPGGVAGRLGWREQAGAWMAQVRGEAMNRRTTSITVARPHEELFPSASPRSTADCRIHLRSVPASAPIGDDTALIAPTVVVVAMVHDQPQSLRAGCGVVARVIRPSSPKRVCLARLTLLEQWMNAGRRCF
jgi:hypothetical protein